MSLPLRIALSAASRPPQHAYGPDPSQVADLHLPGRRHGAPGPAPIAVVLHGGHWQTRYGRLVTRPLAADLARRGWAAWNLEYRRLGPGRGGGGGWPMTFEDVAAGIDALAELGDERVDTGRVVAVGHSAGGQLALWAAARGRLRDGDPGARPRVPVRAVVALAPVSDLRAAGRVAHALLGGTPDAVPARYAQADPVRLAPLDVPVLVVHPRDDATVDVRRSRAYAARGGDVQLVEPAAGGHRAPIDPAADAWHAAAAWLERLRLEGAPRP